MIRPIAAPYKSLRMCHFLILGRNKDPLCQSPRRQVDRLEQCPSEAAGHREPPEHGGACLLIHVAITRSVLHYRANRK